MNPVALNDSVYIHFGTTRADTGSATDADSLPVVTVVEDGVAMGYSPTVSNVAVGLYMVSIVASVANGFEAGRRYSLHASATVNSVTGRDGIGEFEVLDNDLDKIGKFLLHKRITDPVTGIMTVYESNDSTPAFSAAVKKDAAGTIPYNGTGAERIERMT